MSITANLLRVSKEKLAEVRSVPSRINDLVMDTIQEHTDAKDCLDLYKSWNALHVLLNDGEPGAEADAVLGGKPIGDDLGYGPARVLTVQEVARISAGLANIARSDFEGRFEVDKMQDVYSFHTENAEVEWPILSERFEELKEFYALAAEQSCGMILFFV